MTTIRDIAREAQVSVSTASLALNGDPRVRPATRARVTEAAKRLDYHPSRTAKNLSSGQTRSVHLINPVHDRGLSSSFFTRFVRGIHDVVQDRNYTLALTVLDDEDEADAVLDRLTLERWTDGVILMNVSEDARLMRKLVEREFPHALLGHSALPDVNSVDNDNEAVAYDAALHLVREHGAPLLFLNGLRGHAFVQERALGFRRAHEQRRAPLDEALIQFDVTNADEARARVSGLLRVGAQFKGVLASSDEIAIGALRSLRDHGLRVPDDVAVVGINNDEFTDYTDPSLTSVDLSVAQLGREAADLLIRSIERHPAERRLVGHHLVQRGSS